MAGPTSAARIALLESEIEAEIDKLLASSARGKDSKEHLDELIEKVRKRRSALSVRPEFTPEVVGIAKQIVAFGAAGFSFALAFGDKVSGEWSALTQALTTLYVNVTLVSLAILVWFFLQARTRYPWLYLEHLGNSSQYFYYNAVPTTYRYHPFYLPWNRNTGLERDLTMYLRNLESFARGSVRESKREELKNELLQYHVLVFYQGYLDQYEQQLTHTALYGFIASALCSAAVLIWGLL